MNRATDTTRRAVLAFALAAGVAATPHAAAAADAYAAGDAAAAAALGRHPLRLLDGSRTTLAAWRGQVVIVNFWATWCTPCRRELPKLDALHRALAGDGARVLAVSIDGDAGNVRRWASVAKLAMPVALDGPDGLAKELDLKSVPATVVLDREGRVAWSSGRGDEAALAQLETVVRRLAAAPVADGGAR